ncbi:hypothetical protein EFK50_16235 [Nocardioides marmoriginsengisoli]|uniref:Glycoside-hydrolase family GH114 TIM-barrel domain-containing protein n=1 Tax=Nocardioides marmoriginsengisoli TaxID=661483 RepID=A0A3N0CIH2_9ACTN|nr:endo alpha-1,4 polygalactosaminidase [Nocardioides marmoriginsengisoli]RNL63240.1 hypothetical protein EFK50_16235 [Nocardioides marmoriginsengisoli]
MTRVLRTLLIALVLPLLVPGAAEASVTPLPTAGDADYQLGGTRSVPESVTIVVRDRRAAPVPDRYNICYVNGFQTQPDERRFWRKHGGLVLKRNGRPVVDEGWGEWLLDTRTPAKRQRLATILGRWIDGCARSGFDAVEFDNLDSFSRSRRLISRADNRAMARLLVARAHRAGLAAGQKNWAEWNGRRAGFDFAIAESCGRWRECGAYVAHYGARVVAIEYRRADFAWTCARYGDRLPVVLRDRDLTSAGVRRFC